MSGHTTSADPFSMLINICIVISELLGAVIAVTSSDMFMRWSSWGMVACGLFINYTINRKKFNTAISEWWNDLRAKLWKKK